MQTKWLFVFHLFQEVTSLESFCVSWQELERPTPEIPAA